MYQVLIVDDEKHAVRGIRAGVQWERLGVKEVYSAYNAKQARAVLEKTSVDLLLCDIEMPKESGLELLEWMKGSYPHVEVIFLTCHSDFSFAQKALKLKSFDYLLKPVDYVDLESVIKKAFHSIETTKALKKFEATYRHYQHLQEANQPKVMERFWRDLLLQNISSAPQMIEQYLAQKGINIVASMRYLPVHLQLRQWNKKLTGREERIMEFALCNAAEETLSIKEDRAVVFPVKNNVLVAVLPIADKAKGTDVKSRCDDYVKYCKQYLYCDISCCIGEPVYMHEMVHMYHRLQNFVDHNILLHHSTIDLAQMMNGRELRVQPPAVSEWLELMKFGDKAKLLSEINQYFDSWERTEGVLDVHTLHIFYQDILQMILHMLQVNGLQANEVFSKGLLMERPDKVMLSLEVYREWVCYIVEVAMNNLHSLPENISVVSRVERYISEHIENENLSREEIANHVYLNPSYLSRVFKKEKGITITDYLQQQRLELAKKLLDHTDLSISEISLKVGYSNLSYFSTLFKKTVQMNPSEYRNRKTK